MPPNQPHVAPPNNALRRGLIAGGMGIACYFGTGYMLPEISHVISLAAGASSAVAVQLAAHHIVIGHIAATLASHALAIKTTVGSLATALMLRRQNRGHAATAYQQHVQRVGPASTSHTKLSTRRQRSARRQQGTRLQ